MSKSKKNTIDPQKIIENYGADSARLFILSDSPPEKDIQWSDEGINSSYKFLQKLWKLNSVIMDQISMNHKKDSSDKFSKFTNQYIKKMTDSLNTFSYNVLIANLHEMHNFLIKEIINGYSVDTIKKNYSKILTTMLPIIPHFALECKELNNFEKNEEWPIYDPSIILEKDINYVIQINGKKRLIFKNTRDQTEDKILIEAKKDKNLNKYLGDKVIKKTIFVKNRLLNIII